MTNRITVALCDNDCGLPSVQVIGRESWCAECGKDLETCQACGSWVKADAAVHDDAGAYHENCYGPNEDAAYDAEQEA